MSTLLDSATPYAARLNIEYPARLDRLMRALA